MTKTIILTGKTRKGKDIIFVHGDEWIIIERRENVICFHNRPGLFIRSPKTGTQRWIELNEDHNFSYSYK